MGRPEADETRQMAMSELGSGLSVAKHHEDASTVREAQLSTMRRVGAQEAVILAVQSNLANTYEALGRGENATRIFRDVYSGYLKLYGKEYRETLREACNYAASFLGSRSSKKSNH